MRQSIFTGRDIYSKIKSAKDAEADLEMACGDVKEGSVAHSLLVDAYDKKRREIAELMDRKYTL